MGDVRAARQKRYLQDLLHDKAGVELKENTSYLDAICAHPDPVDIVSRVISSKKGLSYIAQSMRFSFSATFLNGTAATFLHYIQHQDLVTISSGAFLRQILLAVAQPPLFFNAFKQAFCDGVLNESAETAFGWMLFQLISSLPTDESEDFLSAAKDDAVARHFASSQSLAVRTYGQKIKHYVDSASIPFTSTSNGPGGRHDNDFIDFREIVIRPTPDEIATTTLPFLRLAHELSEFPRDNTGLALHLDNQFRLLREDMLHDMREELKMIQSPQKKKGKFRRGFPINGLALHGAHLPAQSNSRWGVSLRALTDLSQFKGEKRVDKRLAILKDNKKIMRHGSLACLLINNEIIAFPTITRDEDLLAGNPPVVVLAFEGRGAISTALSRLKAAAPAQVTLVQVDTAIFSYEPVLQALQNQRTFNLADKLLAWKNENDEQDRPPWSAPAALASCLAADPSQDVRSILGLTTKDPIRLDLSQMKALVSGLTQRLSLIQGPPGTGKSFIGSLITKVLHARTNGTVLVVCYTNHALDQFIDDLCKIGIPQDDVVRIGKASPSMKQMSLYEQKRDYKFKRADWTIIDGFKADSAKYRTSLQSSFQRYMSFAVSLADLLVYLEDEEPTFANAFEVIPPADGMTRVGKGRRKVEGTYLLENWRNGGDARPCETQSNVIAAPQIWNMAKTERQSLIAKWEQQLFAEEVDVLSDTADQYNKSQAKVDRHFSETDANVLRNKRIIACTTTGAAKYIELIQRAAQPDIVVVEEAGEILESHVLTALAPDTKQLVLIGDHKQLRPKVDNYRLTVEKGDGFDLNRSLFERLVLSDFPHETLLEQHRMRPEISSLVRDLTYPDLKDAPKTFNRPSLRGLQNDIIFISHTHPEDDLREVADRRDQGAPSSKQNTYEVQMVLKIVRYLGQQGYGTENIVILTPYLGQLYKLIDALRSTTDPVLNDLDSYDLVRAGLIPAASAKLAKKSIRIATIDNYQGEESDIVIASLTRSNERKDIGFMAAPERVNVLLSRARLGLILIGNVDTFSHSRKGRELWQKIFGLLHDKAAVFEGLPVQCERHPARKSILSDARSFDELCPEGGCLEICGAPLNCSLHTCQSPCHQLADHSKLPCNFICKANCPKGHRLSWKCSEKQPICHTCERERKRDEKAQQKEFEREQKKEKERVEHERKMVELDEQIKEEQAKIRNQQLEAERQQALEQKRQDLKDVAARAQIRTPRRPPTPIPTTPKPAPTSQPTMASNAQSSPPLPLSNPSSTPAAAGENENNEPEETSPSEAEWIRLKTVGGESNDALDGIMGMTGLEEVKTQVMAIKVKIETARRQGISGNTDRLNVAMLGNPGTGKTTIARLYAKFLFSVGALPGSHFEETTGSKLGSEGVDGAKKLLATVQNAGGGVIFIDEAYQLTSQSNFGGRQVLDFLLAEMENNTGKIVFIVAGYRKQMESFFEHNPGIPSRVPYQMQFQDYSDKQLRCMLRVKIEKKWGGKMKVEGGLAGLFMRIVASRLGRGRGQEGFGNARALENVLAGITERQAKRLDLERRAGNRPDDFLLTREDLIGPEPSQALQTSDSWKSLQSMIGLESVKDSITALFEQIQDNYQRELRELKPVETSLNKVFSGSPGTGKTTVAKLYGQILAEIGLLSNGEVVVKNPSDFIGSALGQSEEKTRGILESTKGKVLIIDEAYMLYQASGSGSNNADPYRAAVVDTLVAEVQNVPGDDRCVLLAGYKSEMEQMFQNVNPGLARRFDMENAFEFHDFSDAELRQILDGKLKAQELDATDSAKDVAIRVLGRERNRPNFGNAGAVDLILTRAKGRYKQRKAKPTAETNWTLLFEPQDFDPDFDRDTNAESSIDELFADIVGCDTVKQKLKQFTKLVQLNRLRGRPLLSQIPTSFVFKGPPGTGKTTVARKIGQVFYNMNFLSSTEVLERSAKDLVGQYVGQTAPKVAQLFDEALGRVLFIDEAYRLAEGHFAKEAMDEIVALMTHPKYKGNLIVILAGYDEDMNRLLSVNPGLASRFPEEIAFENMRPQDCLNVFFRELDKEDIEYPDLADSNSSYLLEMHRLLRLISSLSSWGNARDIKTLAQRAIQHVLLNASSSDSGLGSLILTGDTSVQLLNQMYEEQSRRANIAGGNSSSPQPPIQFASPPNPIAPSIQTTTVTPTTTQPPEQPPPPDVETSEYPPRDAGVSEEDWQRLQAGREAEKKALADAKASFNALLAQILKANKDAAAAEREERAAEAAILEAERIAQSKKLAVAAAEDAKRKKKLEEIRLKAAKAKAEEEKARRQLEAKRAEEENKRKEATKVQAKLKQMGVCCAGYGWTKVAGGYQCAGGVCFVSNAQLGI
ncbi:P-loop containing nucleoside triphosphate hydrolase protein [Flagelloscypha sp. PMI_526]|nr:P-loop containing nucleoside triphosphate hydrolase protein [Flagelloscypha sp. PMI_526]